VLLRPPYASQIATGGLTLPPCAPGMCLLTSTPTLRRPPRRLGASYHRSGHAHGCADTSAIADSSALPSQRSARHVKRFRMVPFLQWPLLSLAGDLAEDREGSKSP
jgi:hypothetical protein